MELTALFGDSIADLIGNEGWCGEDELQGIDLFQLILEGLIGVDGKAGGGDLKL
ncbi:MAG: hypothetical protein M3H12_13775 [Chromatiales bacterium]